MTGKNGDTARCAVLVGPYLSGKTSLFEALLLATGTLHKKGTVKDGNTVGDSAEEARKRQASTELNVGQGAYLDEKWTFIDTPGNLEFSQDMRNACMVADIAIVVAEPEVSKVPALTHYLKFLDAHDIPHVIFVNKIEDSHEQVRDLVLALQDVSDRPLALRQVPIRDGEAITGFVDLVSERAYQYQNGKPSKLVQLPDSVLDREKEARNEMLETLSDFDDGLLEKLLEEVEPAAPDVYAQLTETLQHDLVVPILLGGAEKDHGIQRLLKTLRHEAPGADSTAERLGIPQSDGPVAQVFKTVHASHVGKLSYVRVWRGTVKDGDELNGQRVSGINHLLGAKMDKVSSVSAGDVAAFGRMDEIATGDLLTPDGKARLDWPEPLTPVYGLAISPTSRGDEVKLSGALTKLGEEDSSFRVEHSAALGELVIRGQGDTHLKVMLERLEGRYKLAVESHAPGVPYKESIRKGADQHARHKKQTGGHGQFGDVKIKIAPLSRGEGFAFKSSIVGGAVPKQYIPAVEEGVKDYMRRGPLGFEVVDVAVELYDGSFHAVDSSDMAFKTAARMAMNEGLAKCQPVLLEPIQRVVISVPNDSTARVQRIVTGRRGQILGFQAKESWNGWDEIEAYLPESETRDLIIEIRSQTGGIGFYDGAFDHLAELTGRIADQVVEGRIAVAD
ncbi:elongation factor G [Nisaea sediminum]|uniref:elongation factor G n=1 Tax=Nisaea sediminum TaxID=2775867 RepID=UPI00186823CB|nr:elongation factor G [Nisaea sediminum]